MNKALVEYRDGLFYVFNRALNVIHRDLSRQRLCTATRIHIAVRVVFGIPGGNRDGPILIPRVQYLDRPITSEGSPARILRRNVERRSQRARLFVSLRPGCILWLHWLAQRLRLLDSFVPLFVLISGIRLLLRRLRHYSRQRRYPHLPRILLLLDRFTMRTLHARND